MATLDTLVYQFQRELQLVIKINGVNLQPVTSNALADTGVPGVSGVRVSKALDSPTPVCDIDISHLATWIRRGHSVTIDAGYVGALSQRVFTGYVQSRERKVAGATLKCLGKSYSLFRTIQIGDVDVSGKTAKQAIKDILTDVGITDRNVNVGSFTLNTSGQDTMKLERMPASQMVQMLADIDGSRIYETNAGTVIIGPIEEVPAPTAIYTYTTSAQATAIILGGSDREDPDYFRNQVIITGATLNASGGDEAVTLTATAVLTEDNGLIQPPMPSGTVIGTEYSNQLIDTQAQCETLALLLLSRYARVPRYLNLEIAGDPRLDIGMTVQLDFDEMSINSSRWFVHGVSHSIDGSGGYRTTLQLRGGDLLGGTLTLAPVATFTAMSEVENMGGRMITVISLDASASYDPDGTITDPTGYVWTANQPITMGTGKRLTVNADTTGWVGDLEITLTLTDNDGATSTSMQVVPYGGAADVIIPAIYAAINNNATATLDGGRTWNNYGASTAISIGARPDDGVLSGYACVGYSNGTIRRTTDGFATTPALVTWSGTAPTTAINDIQWDWRNLNVVWAVTEVGQVCISLDAGATWSIYSDLRTITYVSGAATAGAIGNKLGLPADGGVYIFGGDGVGSPLIAYDAVIGAKAWVHQTFTGDLLTDTVTTPGDATLRIVDAVAAGGLLGTHIILAWASGGGASITAVYYSTSDPGPSVAYTRASTTFGGLKTGRFIVQDLTTAHCAFANRSVWHSTDGIAWTETANVFPANTVPWHAIWFGAQQGRIQGGIFAAALEDTVTPNNGYIVKSVDGFVTAPVMRPTTGSVAVTWPASAKGKKLSIGAIAANQALSGNVYAMSADQDDIAVLDSLGSTWVSRRNAGNAVNAYFKMKYGAGALWRIRMQGSFPTGTDTVGQLERSLDSGVTWSPIGDAHYLDSDGNWYGVQNYDFGTNGWLWVGKWAEPTTNDLTSAIKLYRIKNPLDPTPTWELMYTDPVGPVFGSNIMYGQAVVCHPLNPDIVLIQEAFSTIEMHFVRTINGTATSPDFTSTGDVSAVNTISDIIMFSNGNLAGYRSATLRYSEDYGATWGTGTDRDIGGNVIIDYTSGGDQILYRGNAPAGSVIGYHLTTANGGTQIFVSVDNGKKWRRIFTVAGLAYTPTLQASYDHVRDVIWLFPDGANVTEISGVLSAARDGAVATDKTFNLGSSSLFGSQDLGGGVVIP